MPKYQEYQISILTNCFNYFRIKLKRNTNGGSFRNVKFLEKSKNCPPKDLFQERMNVRTTLQMFLALKLSMYFPE